MRKNLIARRKKLNLTQKEMSEMLGIARTTYSSYELGTTSPPLVIAIKIKELLRYKNDNIFLIESVRKTNKNTKSIKRNEK